MEQHYVRMSEWLRFVVECTDHFKEEWSRNPDLRESLIIAGDFNYAYRYLFDSEQTIGGFDWNQRNGKENLVDVIARMMNSLQVEDTSQISDPNSLYVEV